MHVKLGCCDQFGENEVMAVEKLRVDIAQAICFGASLPGLHFYFTLATVKVSDFLEIILDVRFLIFFCGFS